MSYATTNPPILMVPRLGDQASAFWVYVSTDPPTDVDNADYITNALALGMKVNDIVFVVDSDGPTVDVMMVTAVDADGATLLNGT